MSFMLHLYSQRRSLIVCVGNSARMSKCLNSLLVAVVAWTALAGCAHTRPQGARLAPSAVARMAEWEAQRNGFSLSKYQRQEPSFGSNKVWSVFFQGQEPVPGNLIVFIDDQMEHAQIMSGLIRGDGKWR